MHRSFILWNSIPSITNKQIQEENSRRQRLIRNMVLSEDGFLYFPMSS